MIKTLRITSIAAAVLAVIFLVFFVFPVVFGFRSDKQIEECLNSPGVIEKFNTTVGNKAKTGQNQESPLVQQAGAFALYLNPPPETKPPRTAIGSTAGITRGPAVPPKFKIIGTSYYKDRPELSMALIDEPGKGLTWYRQSSEVGHFLIEQVKDGLVVFKDSKGTFEQKVELKPEISLLAGADGASTASPVRDAARDTAYSPTGVSGRTDASSRKSTSGRASVSPARDTAYSKAGISSRTRGADSPKTTSEALGITETDIAEAESEALRPPLSKEEHVELNDLAEKLREVLLSFKSDKAGSGPSAKEKAALIEKIISEYKSSKSSRLSAEEAERLTILGKELKKVLEESELNPSVPEDN